MPILAQYRETSSIADLHADEARSLRKKLRLEARFVGRLVVHKGVEEHPLALNEV